MHVVQAYAVNQDGGEAVLDEDVGGGRAPDGHMWPHLVIKRQIDDAVKALIEDFAQSKSLTEGLAQLVEMCHEHPEEQHHVVKRLLSGAMDRNEEQQQMIMKLLTSARLRDEISPESFREGFLKLMEVVDEMVKDVPQATTNCGCFLACAVVDKCLTEDVLEDVRRVTENSLPGQEVISNAQSFLSSQQKLAVEAFKEGVTAIIEEYLQEADLDEAQVGISGVAGGHFDHEIVKRIVILALNMKSRERELASKLLQACHREGLISEEQLEDGFVRLVWRLNDLVLDTPDAPHVLAQFVVRGIADGYLREDFLDKMPASLVVEGTLGGNFASKASLFRSKTHAHFNHPENIWGAGVKGVDELKTAIRSVLREFFENGDTIECLKSIRALEAPHFLHEVVAKAIIISLDHGDSGQLRAHLLLQAATEQGLVTPTQVAQGLERVLSSLHDIVIDVPNAPVLVARFLFQAFEDGWASRDLLKSRKGGPWGEHFSHGDRDPAEQRAYDEIARLDAL